MWNRKHRYRVLCLSHMYSQSVKPTFYWTMLSSVRWLHSCYRRKHVGYRQFYNGFYIRLLPKFWVIFSFYQNIFRGFASKLKLKPCVSYILCRHLCLKHSSANWNQNIFVSAFLSFSPEFSTTIYETHSCVKLMSAKWHYEGCSCPAHKFDMHDQV